MHQYWSNSLKLKIFICLVSLLPWAAPMAAKADDGIQPALEVCATPTSSYCVVSFAIKGPGLSDFVTLESSGTESFTRFYSASGTSYSPTDGYSEFQLLGRNSESALSINVNKNIPGSSSTGLDPDTSIRIVRNLGKNLPGTGIANIQSGIYSLNFIDGNYQLLIEGKALPYIAYGGGNCQNMACPTEVAQSDSRGIFFFRAMSKAAIIFDEIYLGLTPSSKKAWSVVETNSFDNQVYIQRNGILRVKIVGPHYLPDGKTLNVGYLRILMTNQLITDYLLMSIPQALDGGIVVESDTSMTGTSQILKTNEDFVEIAFSDFHYSQHEIVISPNSKLKDSTAKWLGKKSSIKRNKALTVKSSVKSNKKKAAGTMRVDLVNSAGVVVGSLNSNVKKGSGKVTFSKSFTKQLAPGKYTVKINYFGSGTAKNTSRSYSLKVK